MIDLMNNNDASGRKTLRVNEITKDRKEHWDIKLQANNFPTAFENSSAQNRKLNLSVVKGEDFNPSDNANSFLIPLVLIALSRAGDQTICYYRSRHESQDDTLFTAKISASVTLEDGQDTPVENPHLLIGFDTNNQDNNNQLSGDQQQFAGTRQQSTFVNTTAGENAQGGVDIPIGQMDRGLQPGDKVVAPA